MKTKLPIYGMHCKACELLVESRISELSGVQVKGISQTKNYIEIETENTNDLEKIKEIITSLGYEVEKKQKRKNNLFDYIIIFLLFVLFGILYFLFQDVDFVKNIANVQNASLLVVILIGFVASLSSCLAVTGGIVLGFSKYMDHSKNASSGLAVQSKFHIGRVIGFALGGGILGSVGGYFGSLGSLNIFLLFLAGIFMIYMGLHILNIIPSLKISIPKVFGSKILNMKNPALAPIIGALTFFLPCGFTQSMQVYAASSGSFLSGALIMGAFALGTMPVLFLLGFGSSYFKNKDFHYANKVIGVIVIYFGIFMLTGFNNLVALSTPIENEKIDLENISFEQKTILHNGWSLAEKEVYLDAGKNYKLNIIPTKDGSGCMSTLTIPGIDKTIHQVLAGKTIGISIVNAKPGTYNIVCSTMGMKQGEIIIQ
ncbi:MAG: sulfite exporter TauE/SafE family protein [Candidatus Altimarinota bacterium]